MIARTGYIVSIISYVTFLTLDVLRPGFVSNFLSPHIFLLSAIIFGIFWARQARVSSNRLGFASHLVILFLGLTLAIFAWTQGRPFGDWRILVTLTTFVAPYVVSRQLTNHD